MRGVAFAILMLLPGPLGACTAPAGGPSSRAIESESEETGWAGAPLTSDPAQAADGRRIAEKECAACHAIDARSKSRNPAAPPLREVLAVNDADRLAYRFIDALRVGHDEMPLFDFDVRAADALVAYLVSIAEP